MTSYVYAYSTDQTSLTPLLEDQTTEPLFDKLWVWYFFGYNKKLAPTDETVTLFDKVQLKSFIDGEVVGASEIGVCCYGIQADNLELGGIDLNVDYLDGTRLNGILSIVKNKLAGSA